jgi:hypothetical protein
MARKLGHFRKQMRNAVKVLKCGVGEWTRSVGSIVSEMRKYYVE